MNNADKPVNPTDSLEDDGAPYYKAINSIGLTKREHFAAMAMQGILSSGMNVALGPSHPINNGNIALCSLTLADALLAALEAKG